MKAPLILTWQDPTPRAPSHQMALDEALFHLATERETAIARFYTWDAPAVTLGYFDRMPPGTTEGPEPIRRFTGGGRVEHGDDLTLLLAFPRNAAICDARHAERYQWIHRQVADALAEADFPLLLESAPLESSTGPCFENPVTWDLLEPRGRKKIGGGAQRRTREGLIHQGSFLLPPALRSLGADWIEDFLLRIADRTEVLSGEIRAEAETRAETLARERYASPGWNATSVEERGKNGV